MNHPAPLYLQIQQFLRLAIEQGRFRAGDKLPSEPELAERFGTTRATVARALQQLVFEGLIARRAGSGTFVSSPRIDDRVDTNLLESFEDHMIAAGASLQYELLAFESESATPELSLALGLQAATLWRLERLRFVGGRKVALEVRHMPESLARGIDVRWLEQRSVQQVLREGLGLQIGRMENAVSASVASAEQARILGAAKGAALLVREHTIFDTKGRALLHGRTYYAGKFSVRYTLGPEPDHAGRSAARGEPAAAPAQAWGT
jgi:GntR family transcriptional regulator